MLGGMDKPRGSVRIAWLQNMPALWQEEFSVWRRRQQYDNRSAKTVSTHGTSILGFARWMEAEGQLTPLENVRTSDIEGWFIATRSTAKGNTLLTRYAGLRSFFAFLTDEGLIPADPMKRLKPPKVTDQPTPTILRPDHVKALLTVCSGTDFLATRDKALIRFLLESGARIGEVASVRLDGLDQDARSAVVQAKGGGQRVVLYSQGAAYLLDRYLMRRRRHSRHELSDLWIGKSGALRPDAIDNMLRTRSQQAALPFTVHAHLFRHTWADAQKRNGVSEESIRQLGGWSDRSPIPLQYGRALRAERAAEEQDRLRPFDRF